MKTLSNIRVSWEPMQTDAVFEADIQKHWIGCATHSSSTTRDSSRNKNWCNTNKKNKNKILITHFNFYPWLLLYYKSLLLFYKIMFLYLTYQKNLYEDLFYSEIWNMLIFNDFIFHNNLKTKYLFFNHSLIKYRI